MASTRIGMVLFPSLTQLDLTGPYEVFARIPDCEVTLVAESLKPVRSELGLSILPDHTLWDAPPLDVLFVPGGAGIEAAMQSEALLTFLKERAETAAYVTSVCTGSLVLGAAGLLRGYRATTHWLSLELLASLGAQPVKERVVVDRNRITGAGVTAGIDFALKLAATLRGDAAAQKIQLTLEYAPAPPFQSGSPQTTAQTLVDEVTAQRGGIQQSRRASVESAARRLGL
jgi:cyclohexyl-isocyanide hydratase